jgi:RNA polymerase sigma-70 factor (ECF subfamily)
MTATNKKDGRKRRRSREGKAMSVGVIEKVSIIAKRKVRVDPVADIVASAKEGDPAAFKQLFEKHVAGVHRHLSLLIGPNEDVDDLVQLVFMNVYQSIGRFRGKSAFSTWLFRITINVARQEIRMRGRRRKLSSAIFEVGKVAGNRRKQTPEGSLSTWQQIYLVLDRLSPKKRETFILYMYEGYSLEEIASLLGSSVSTIGSRLQAGRKEILAIMASEKKR